MAKVNILIGIGLIIFSLIVFIYAGTFPEGPYFNSGNFPRIATTGIIILSLVMTLKNWKLRKEKNKISPPEFSEIRKIIFLVIALVIYTFLLRILGFIYATFLLMFVVFQLAGVDNWVRSILYSVTLSVAIYFVFYKIFLVFLPQPSLPLPHP